MRLSPESTLLSAAAQLENLHTPFVMVTLVNSRGHAPQDPGAKMLVTENGLYAGTVGGGKIEAACIQKAIQLLKAPQQDISPQSFPPTAPVLETLNLQRDIGMSCGGEVQMLFEVFSVRPWKIAVFGAGHVAQALAQILSRLKCQVTFIDTREEWLNLLSQSNTLKCVQTTALREEVARFDSSTFFLCVTQGHAHDVPVLHEIFLRFPEAPFIGVIGSTRKGQAIRRDLVALGISPLLIERLHCPVGLPFGSNDPFEIAISISGKFLSVRDSIDK